MKEVKVFQAKILTTPSLRHGFFGRGKNTASGVYACAMGVAEPQLMRVQQIHSARAVHVDAPWRGEPAKADALVSAAPGLALSVITADCAPVLLADTKAGIVGAAHAGWRGALDGILEATLEAMRELGASPDNIHAAIGPCIAQESYEVGPEFLKRFIEVDAENAHCFKPGKGDHWHFDLKSFCEFRLGNAGIGKVETMPQDTCADEQSFFSYRRATLRGESDYGRNVSVIVLRKM